MANPFHHALSAASEWGGEWEDYIEIEQWFDQTKAHLADCRHRLILHNDFGLDMAAEIFGPIVRRASDGVAISTREVGQRHIEEDCAGRVPSVAECLKQMPLDGATMRSPRSLARLASQRMGGHGNDYVELAEWLNRGSSYIDDGRHRVLMHHSLGLFLCEQRFSPIITRASDGKRIPTRTIAELFVVASCGGRIRTLEEALRDTPITPELCRGARRLSMAYG